MKKEIICGIYKITSPTGRVYIGQSIDIYKRFATYRNFQCKSQPRLMASFKSHGVTTHKFEIIHVSSECELNSLEKYYVDLYNSFNTPHGLNLIDGGGSYGKRSDETKRKNSESMSGEKHPWFGKKQPEDMIRKRVEKLKGKKMGEEQKRILSARNSGNSYCLGRKHTEEELEKIRAHSAKPEVREARSQRVSGENNPMWGKELSPETKEKIRLKNTGSKRTMETRKKMSDKAAGSNNPFYGKKHTKESLLKAGVSIKEYWNKLKQSPEYNSPEAAQKRKEIAKKRWEATKNKLKNAA